MNPPPPGTKTTSPSRCLSSPPLSKHHQGQKKDGHTGYWCLDKLLWLAWVSQTSDPLVSMRLPPVYHSKTDSMGFQYQSECCCEQEEPSQIHPAPLSLYNQHTITKRSISDHKTMVRKNHQNNSHMGSSCLDKPVLGHRTMESPVIGPHPQTYALIQCVLHGSCGEAATHIVRAYQQGTVRRHINFHLFSGYWVSIRSLTNLTSLPWGGGRVCTAWAPRAHSTGTVRT